MTAPSDITITDMFCGAGGSSQGAHAIGLRVRMAANHWKLAVDSHAENFPDADHDCADISSTDPRRYPTTTILWASPECTNHSQAKGRKREQKHTQMALGDDAPPLPDEAAERSRATMWDVPRFAEYHGYRYIVVENVTDARHWTLFDSWIHAMHALGYEHEIVWLNSMHAATPEAAPAPQSRDRMYVVFWRRGERRPDLGITPAAWCGKCDTEIRARQSWKQPLKPWGRYGAHGQYVYRCPSCLSAVEPFVLPAAYAIDWTMPGQRIGDREKALAPKTLMRIEAGIRRYARPFHLEAAANQYDAADPKHAQHARASAYYRVWAADTDPLKTLHTLESKAIAVPPMLAPAGGTWRDDATSVEDPMPTRTTRESDGLLVPPFLTVHRSRDDDDHRTRPLDQELPTPTASGNFLGAVVPPLAVPVEGRSGKRASSLEDPFRTQSTRNETGVLVPPFIAELRGGGSVARPVGEPLATVTAAGNHHGLVQPPELDALMLRNNSSRGDGAEMSTPVREPMRTLTTAGHQSLVAWSALYGYDTGALRSLGIPLPTQTTVQGDALLTGQLPDVEDCLFRMLEPHEIGAGMAFARDYIVLGNKRERVRMYGNAVTPPASTLLLGRVVQALTGEQAAA